jgi:hypothetical protein
MGNSWMAMITVVHKELNDAIFCFPLYFLIESKSSYPAFMGVVTVW